MMKKFALLLTVNMYGFTGWLCGYTEAQGRISRDLRVLVTLVFFSAVAWAVCAWVKEDEQ